MSQFIVHILELRSDPSLSDTLPQAKNLVLNLSPSANLFARAGSAIGPICVLAQNTQISFDIAAPNPVLVVNVFTSKLGLA
jgi:hypothetical protein